MTLAIGIDIGQMADPSAVVVAHLREGHIYVLRMERLPLRMSYPMQVQRFVAMLQNLKTWAAGRYPYRPTVLMDTTGVGRAVVDMTRESVHPSIKVIAVTLTAGSETTRSGNELHASKQDLVDQLRRLMEEQRLHIPPASAEARAISTELRMFQGTKISADKVATGARSGHHDDLVVSLALACFGATTSTRSTATVRDADLAAGDRRPLRTIYPKREGDPLLVPIRRAYDGVVYADQHGNLIHKPSSPRVI